MSWSRRCGQMEEDCSTRRDRRQRKPVFRTGSEFSVLRNHDFLDFFFGEEAANDAQSVWVNTACGKDHSQKNQSKPILWYSNIYNQIASDI